MNFIEIGILITLEVTIVLSWLFLKSYINKKGENLATLNDIDEITKSVEEIKFEFAKLIEEEKITNALVRERTMNYNTKKDEMLFECFEDTTKFKTAVNDNNTGYFAIENQQKFQRKITEIDECHDTFKLNVVKLSAFHGASSNLLKKYEQVNMEIGEIAIKWYELSAELSAIKSDEYEGKKEYIEVSHDGLRELIDLHHDRDNRIDELLTEFANEIKKYFEKSPK